MMANAEADAVATLARVVDAERQYCRFLSGSRMVPPVRMRFVLARGRDRGPAKAGPYDGPYDGPYVGSAGHHAGGGSVCKRPCSCSGLPAVARERDSVGLPAVARSRDSTSLPRRSAFARFSGPAAP